MTRKTRRSEPDPMDLIRLAALADNRGDLPEAIEAVERASVHDRTRDWAAYDRAMLLLRSGDRDGAYASLIDATETRATVIRSQAALQLAHLAHLDEQDDLELYWLKRANRSRPPGR